MLYVKFYVFNKNLSYCWDSSR